MKNFVMSILFLFMGVGFVAAQNRITGTVVDNTGEPVVSVAVVVKGTTVGTTTDLDGKFSINVPEGKNTLVFKLIGMLTTEARANNGMRVVLEEDENLLGEVVVTGYGNIRKDSYTGSASTISAKAIEKRTISNVSKAIEGTVPGVTVTSGTGQPGSGASIRVRGFGSINASNDPLYVVDGAAYDGSLAAINPDDIASMTILKDASAGALYGARGANGVIIITTKRGAEIGGKVQVEFKAKWGVASRLLPRYELMNEKQWLEASYVLFRNEQIYNNGVNPDAAGAAAINAMVNGNNRLFGVNEQYNPYNMPIAQLIDPVTGKVDPSATLRYHENWMDEVSAESPLRQEYNLSLRGGLGKTKYYMSFNYLDENGLLETTSFSRLGGNLSIDSNPVDIFTIGGNASFAFNKTNELGSSGTSTSNVWYSAQNMAPIYPVHILDENGQIVIGSDGKPTYDYGENRTAGAQNNWNSVAVLYEDAYFSNSDNLNISGYAAINLNEKYGWAQGINAKLNVNSNMQNSRSTVYYNPLFGNAAAQGGRLQKSANRYVSYTLTALLGYNRTFGQHGIDVIAGHEYYSYKFNYLYASKTGFPFPGLYELAPGSTTASIDSYENNYAIESILSRARYTYANKYNLDASLRRDASSRFHPDYRWGTFWSVGANWRISEESFLQNVDWLDNLAVRASYGVQGNDNIGSYYAWQSFYNLGYPNADRNGSVLSSLENSSLKWEKNANFNVGFDARMFNRLDITAEFYNKNTSDLLLDKPMATSLGFDSYRANIGSVNNKGFEFSVGVDVIRSTNFNWRFTAIASTLKNKITSLVDEKPIISGIQIYKVGSPLYTYYLANSAGVDPATGKQLYWAWDEVDPVTNERLPDSEPYITDDPTKASNSRVTGATTIPKLYGSFGSEFKIFDFDFSFLTSYQYGGKVYDSQYMAYMNPLYRGDNYHVNMLRAWQKPGDVTDISRPMFNDSRATTHADLIDASYFAIKNITLGYTIPKRVLKKAGLSTVRVYVVGDNLAMFTHLKGMNPQSAFSGVSTYVYTPVRTISAGININF
jgi:TonB-linked SusC/RagA family outer membrane protein